MKHVIKLLLIFLSSKRVKLKYIYIPEQQYLYKFDMNTTTKELAHNGY